MQADTKRLGFDKRYWIFGGNCYYPTGGISDFLFSVDEINRESIEAFIKSTRNEWWHAFDTVSQQIVAGDEWVEKKLERDRKAFTL